jgi:glycosyltransferase involved in cell wall biosynthesis
VLATLHLPRQLYGPEMFGDYGANVLFNCVSHSQLRSFTGLPRMMGVVENGIEVSRFPYSEHKRDYLLWMGRICEEKGTHVAIDVAGQADLPLIIAGQVYPFSYHQNYFAREVAPRLENSHARVQFVQRPSFTEKLSLLQNARALLIPASIDETSSLVAMEAMACGTPVIAFRRGALPEVIADGETGLIVSSSDDMAQAIKHVHDIEPRQCRTRVESFYDSRRMAEDYEGLYERVVADSKLIREKRSAA